MTRFVLRRLAEVLAVLAVMSFLMAVAKLKAERQRQGLTLADVSDRSRLDIGLFQTGAS